MRNVRVFAGIIFLSYYASFSAAFGETVMDPQQWLTKFNETVQQGKQEEIRKLVIDLPNRAVNRDGLIRVIDLMATVQRGRTPTGVSTLQVNRLGDLIFRGIMMANFESNWGKTPGRPVFQAG